MCNAQSSRRSRPVHGRFGASRLEVGLAFWWEERHKRLFQRQQLQSIPLYQRPSISEQLQESVYENRNILIERYVALICHERWSCGCWELSEDGMMLAPQQPSEVELKLESSSKGTSHGRIC
jgi:hypothetical protein